jgi:hypothetical protein
MLSHLEPPCFQENYFDAVVQHVKYANLENHLLGFKETTWILIVSMANRIEPVSAIKIEPLFPVNMSCLASLSADNFPLQA